MNKRGSVLFYSLMLGITVLVLALALASPTKTFIEDARNQTVGDTIGLDCDNSSISNFDKATCVATDITLPYFIGGLIFIAGALVTAKIIFA
jgi:hypothetical protein